MAVPYPLQTMCRWCHPNRVFSISNVSSLFFASFPQCWSKKNVCDHNWIATVNYLETVGALIGQILVGVMGDWQVVLPLLSRHSGSLIRLQGWSSLGPNSRRCYQVDRSNYAHGFLGCDPQWVVHLLRLVPVLLLCRGWWRVRLPGNWADPNLADCSISDTL